MFASLQRIRPRPFACAVFALGALACAFSARAVEPTAAAGASLREVGRIELAGVRGRIDHLAVDLEGQRLFVAALGADEVEVIDLRAGRRIARLVGLSEPQGVVYVPSLRRLFVAAGASGEVVAFEGDRRVGVVPDLPDADNMRFHPPTGHVVVGYGHGLAVIDPATLAVVRRIALPGHPEAFELAERGPAIYVNVPEVGRLVVVDRERGKVTSDWRLDAVASNYPMALDEQSHRLAIGTRRPSRVLTYDTGSGRLLASSPACGDIDDLFFAGDGTRLLAVCGEGAVELMAGGAATGGAVRRIETSGGARTGLFVPSTRTLFVAVPAGSTSAAQVRVFRVD
ncbi:MAG: YncE family protein [Vitreoscilla sp.]